MSGTFGTIELDQSNYKHKDRNEFIALLKIDLVKHRDERQGFYKALSLANNPNNLRKWMARFALVGSVSSAVATGLRLSTVMLEGSKVPGIGVPADKLDLWFFAIALVAFALLGGSAVYEKSRDLSSTYFRSNAVTLAIRDLWTRLEFEFFKELMKDDDGPISDDDFDRFMKLANAFCNDLNKLTSDEHGEFKTEFLESISELDALAKKGAADTTAALEKATKSHQEDAEKSRKAAEEAAKQAEEAAKAAKEAAEAAAKPGYLNVMVKSDFDGLLTIKVNGKDHDQLTGKNFSLGELKQGIVHLELAANKGDKPVTYDRYLNVTGGLQDVEATLT